jgi:hypothetical protein
MDECRLVVRASEGGGAIALGSNDFEGSQHWRCEHCRKFKNILEYILAFSGSQNMLIYCNKKIVGSLLHVVQVIGATRQRIYP